MENVKNITNKHKELIKDAIIAIAIAAAVLVFIKPVIVSGESMLPNLQDRNYLLLSRQAYNFGEPKHGQVIVFPVEKDDDKLYIKRVIGIPGDTINIKDGKVYVNGKEQNQSYTKDHYTPGEVKDLKVPKGKLFAMGDNRCNSQDSRSEIVGMIDIDDVSGVALLRLWPVSEFGTVKEYK
jgi:signal peptidase I